MFVEKLSPINKFSHLHLFSFLIYFLPLFLIFGPAPADIAISILALYGLFITFFLKRWDLHLTKISVLILLFNILILISSTLSLDPYLSFRSSLFYFRFYLFFIAIIYLINENKNFLKFFFWFFSITLFVLIFDSFFQFYFKYNITGNILTNNRVSSFFGLELILGSYLARLTPIYFALLYFLYSKNKFFEQINILSILIFFIVIVLSGERVSIFINFIFVCIYLLFLYGNKLIQYSIVLVSLITVFFIIISLNTSLKDRIIDYSYSQIFLSSNNEYLYTNSPIILPRSFLFTNDNIKNDDRDVDTIRRVLYSCEKSNEFCFFQKQNLYDLHNLLFNFSKNEFFIEDHIETNSIVSLGQIYEKYINFNINRFKKEKIQKNFIDSKQVNDDFINYNLDDIRQPDLIIQNFYVKNSLFTNVDIKNLLDSELFNKLFFVKNNSSIFFSPEHDTMIRSGINMFKDNILFGVGPRMYRHLCSKPKYAYNSISINYSSCSTSPHNIYIQILSEVGLFGFLILVFIFLCCVYYLSNTIYKKVNNYNISVYKICLILIIFLNLFPFLPTGNFFGNWLSVIFYFPIGFLMYKYKDE